MPRMDIKKARLIGAGAALESLPDGASAKSVKADGHDVDPAEARETLKDAMKAPAGAAREASALRGAAASATETLELGVGAMERTLSKWSVGEKAMALAQSEPEKVTVNVKVDIELDNGSTVKMEVRVHDPDPTNVLRKISLVAETAGSVPIPVVSHVISGSTALLSGLASLGARVFGNKPLAESLQGMAAKHALIAIPVIGHATGGIGAVVNSKGLQRPATVAEVTILGDS